MDDLIYEEFKGTGNMELHLDRHLAERRVFPSINITASGTRQEELLYGPEKLKQIHTLRRILHMIQETQRTETIIERLSKADPNGDFSTTLPLVSTVNSKMVQYSLPSCTH